MCLGKHYCLALWIAFRTVVLLCMFEISRRLLRLHNKDNCHCFLTAQLLSTGNGTKISVSVAQTCSPWLGLCLQLQTSFLSGQQLLPSFPQSSPVLSLTTMQCSCHLPLITGEQLLGQHCLPGTPGSILSCSTGKHYQLQILD